MGQASSRQRASRRPTPAEEHARSTPVPEASTPTNEPSTSDQATAANKRNRRASLRRSILGLVPSSSSASSLSARSRKDSGSSNSSETTRSLRERWRSSRRFSKAPTNLSDLAETSQQPAAPDADREAGMEGAVSAISPAGCSQSQSSEPSASSATPRSSTPRSGAERERPPKQSDSAAVRSDSVAQVPAIVPVEPTTPAPMHPTTEEIHREVAEFLSGRAEEPAAPSSNDSEHEGSRDLPSTGGTANNNHQASPQHFPPPGTLVVVQGVVNTTDTPHTAAPHNAAASSHPMSMPAPSRSSPAFTSPTTVPSVRRRASSLSTPQSSLGMLSPEEGPSSRSRLSSLIRSARGPSDGGSHAHSASVPDADLSSTRNASDSSPSASSMDSTTPPTTPPDTPHSPPSRETPTSPSRGLSPGSIDVLGTLLSVAAAATAASLFSPGLSQSNSQGDSTAPPSPQQPTVRPLSPTPTAGLGALGGLGGLAGLGLNPPNAASPTPQDSRDRIRNVWESIRERVGLNSRNSASSERPIAQTPVAAAPTAANPPSTTTASAPTDRDRMRPSEMMLAEMARALNAGLGLANTAGTTTNGTTERRETPSEGANAAGPHVLFPSIVDGAGTLPPEGSFERFLANLQQDLRSILSEETGAPQESSPAMAPSADNQLAVDETRRPISEAELTPHVHEEEDSSPDDELPALETDSEDSDSDFQDADEEMPDEIAAVDAATRTDTPMPSAGGVPASHSLPSTPEPTGQRRRERPAINLWRLYRFDPIPASHAQEHAMHTGTGTSMAMSGLGATPARPSEASPPAVDAPNPSVAVDGQAPSTTAPATTPANVIVPVIVVGLQSVDINDSDEPEDEAAQTGGQHASAGPSTPVSDAASQEGGRPSTPRGRTWPSRAANALRTWRPGRRGSRTRRNAEGGGSRTFLIYVIGGYYPPNHHMVTGSDNLDSYEALWELAELLGQVKPPTATRTDIDNSGLQIIKASELSQYEEEGKVASNCVDRCLVCLDDYEPDSDLRVMSCRHAFHKECVDKWLTVGRNNCPACRTKGVSVPGDSPSSESTAA